MARQAQTIQWTICEDDTEWRQARGATPYSGPASNRGILHIAATSRWPRVIAPLLLVLLLAAGVWEWRAGQRLVAQDKAELQTALHLEQWAVTQDAAQAARLTLDPEIITDPQPYAAEFAALVNAAQTGAVPLTTTFELVDVRGDLAVVKVRLTPAAGLAYRQTRFYRRIGQGWLRTTPDPTLWGPWRTLETDHLLWRYRRQDQPVIAAIADRADTLAATIARTFGLTLTAAAKIAVTVSIDAPTRAAPDVAARAQLAARAAYLTPTTLGDEQILLQTLAFDLIAHATSAAAVPILLASPAVYLAPDNLADEDLLLQALALALVQRAAGQMVPAALADSHWRSLVEAFSLRQVWSLELPLARWEQPLVRWIYATPPYTTGAVRDDLAAAVCSSHRLWVEPATLHIPLLCDPIPAPAYAVQQMIPPPPTLLRLIPSQTGHWTEGAPGSHTHPGEYTHPGEVVALATLVDYLAAAYGPERLLDLLAALEPSATWDDLLRTVYGVAVADVEAGWCAHLHTVYGVVCPPDHLAQ